MELYSETNWKGPSIRNEPYLRKPRKKVKSAKYSQNVLRVSKTGAGSQNSVTVVENGQWGLNMSVYGSEMGFAVAGEQQHSKTGGYLQV